MDSKNSIKPYHVPFGRSLNNDINLIINQNYNEHHSSIFDKGVNYYPNRSGNFLLLIEEISKYIGCSKEEILLTHGSENALKLIMETYCDNKCKVLIPFPNYPGFIHKAELYKADITYINFHGKDDEYEKFYKEIKNNDIIYISSPNLPIGYEINDSILEYIEKYKNKLFIIDEAYFEYGTKEKSYYNIKFSNLIIVRTFSKAFALAGARVGYIVANKKYIDELRVAYCDKDITDYSTNLCYNAILHKDHYLQQVRQDKKNWKIFFDKLKDVIHTNDVIYEFMVNHGPYFLIFTEHTEYVCNLFKKNGYLVRDKTSDLGRGCIRISLNIEKIMNDLLIIIKKINGYYDGYDIIYLDIDRTIRESNNHDPIEGLIDVINDLSQKREVNFITNNIQNSTDIEQYLYHNKINYNKLICPFKDFNIIAKEYNNGYFIRNDNLYLTKFPNITYELMNFIKTNKIIHIIEEDYTESSFELGIDGDNINLPFIGSFQDLLENHKIDVKYNIIGKKNLILPINNKETIVIGDSNDDLLFAKNNNFYFKRVLNCKKDTMCHLNNIL